MTVTAMNRFLVGLSDHILDLKPLGAASEYSKNFTYFTFLDLCVCSSDLYLNLPKSIIENRNDFMSMLPSLIELTKLIKRFDIISDSTLILCVYDLRFLKWSTSISMTFANIIYGILFAGGKIDKN